MPPFVFCIQDCYYIRAAYQNPRPHRHFAAHVLIGLDGPFITEIDGKHMQATGIAIASNVVHTVRTDADLLVIFIDELTPMARFVKYVLLQGMSCRSLGKETAAAVSGLWQNVRTEEEAVRAAKGTGNLLGLEKLVPPEEDSRVLAGRLYETGSGTGGGNYPGGGSSCSSVTQPSDSSVSPGDRDLPATLSGKPETGTGFLPDAGGDDPHRSLHGRGLCHTFPHGRYQSKSAGALHVLCKGDCFGLLRYPGPQNSR